MTAKYLLLYSTFTFKKKLGRINLIFLLIITSFTAVKANGINLLICSIKNSEFASFTDICPTLIFKSLTFPETVFSSIIIISTFVDTSIAQTNTGLFLPSRCTLNVPLIIELI